MEDVSALTELLVKFTTRFEQYRIPPAPISVPVSLNRSGLSKVIGHILGSGECRHPTPALLADTNEVYSPRSRKC
jgi:hypothetical protein